MNGCDSEKNIDARTICIIGQFELEFGSVCATTNLAPTSAGFGCDLKAPFAQTENKNEEYWRSTEKSESYAE